MRLPTVVIHLLSFFVVCSGQGDNGTDESMPLEVPCQFAPDLAGEWLSTIWGAIVVTNNTITLASDDLGIDKGLTSFTCDKAYDNGNFILKSEEFGLFGNDHSIFTCVSFTRHNQDLFQISISTPRQETHKYLPGEVSLVDLQDHDEEQYCSGESVLTGYFIRKDHELSGAMGCPELLTGWFNLTVEDGDSSQCPEGATFTTCDHPNKTIEISNENCTKGISDLLLDTNSFICVYVNPNNITIIRNGTKDSTVDAFSCLSLEADADGNATILIKKMDHACDGTWKPVPPETDLHSEDYRVRYTGPCETEEEEEPIPETTTTPPSSENVTMSDNSTFIPLGNVTSGEDSENGTDFTDLIEWWLEGDAPSVTPSILLLTTAFACLSLVM